MKLLGGALLFCVANVAVSQNIGVIGEVFPIDEKSFLMWIESRMKTMEESGELNRMQIRWQNAAADYAKRPTPVGLHRALKHHAYRYTPAVVLHQDLRDEHGDIIFQRGTKLNALHSLKNYQPRWLFLDADDEAQVAWAKLTLERIGNARIILVGGDVSRMEALFNQPIYFDQSGRISHQLKIKAIPAMVTRDDQALLVQEFAISEDGHAL